MPSNWPLNPTVRAAAAVTVPHIRTIGFSAGFFAVLALLLIVGRLIPVVPAI